MKKSVFYVPENQSGNAADLSVPEANKLAKEAGAPARGSFDGLRPVSTSPSQPNVGSLVAPERCA